MQTILKSLILTLLSVIILTSHALAVDSAEADEWVIVLQSDTPNRLNGWQSLGYSSQGSYSKDLFFKRESRALATDYQLTINDEWYISSLGVYCLVVQASSPDVEQQVVADARVNWIQKSNLFRTMLSNHSAGLKAVEALERNLDNAVLPRDKTGKGVRIAVIDTAVDHSHPDLEDSVIVVKDFVRRSQPNAKAELHGTAVASTIAAKPNAQLGTQGVAPDASVLSLRACWQDTNGSSLCDTLSLARALNAALELETQIVNLSLSGPQDRLLDLLVSRLIQDGAIVMAAFDPERIEGQRFPSVQQGVVIVRSNTISIESKSGAPNTFHSAPGERLVAKPGSGYRVASGHSIATAFATGALALELEGSRDR